MTIRPAECPACGHEKPRRRLSIPRTGRLFEAPREEIWRCGLCAYEWSQAADPAVPPPTLPS